MKKISFILLSLAIASFAFISCEKAIEQDSPDTPTGFTIEQVKNTLVLSWNSAKNAEEYIINKNGSYWQSTTATTITDKTPIKGINSYELVASNGKTESKPAKASYDFQPVDDPENPGDPEDPEITADYYIKHPWGSGTDNSWAWKAMRRDGSNYTCTGLWGGVGANINNTASDDGATWFAESSISGASQLSVGSTVKFIYNPSAATLSVEGESSGGGGSQETTAFYIKHPWGGNDWSWQPMTQSGNSYTYSGVWGGVGANINSSASDSGAEWYDKSNISGASSVSEGETVTFTFIPYNGPVGSLSVSKNSSGGGGGGGGGGGSTNYEPCPPSVSCSGTSSVTIRWTASTGFGCGTPTSYMVRRKNWITGEAETLKESTSSTSYTDSQPFPGRNLYGVIANNNYGSSNAGTAYSSEIGIAAPTVVQVYAAWNGLDVTVKELNVPDERKPYYSLRLYRSTSSSGTFLAEKEWNYSETIAIDEGKNERTYELDYNTSIHGTTLYYKVCWVFNTNYTPSEVVGAQSSAYKGAH